MKRRFDRPLPNAERRTCEVKVSGLGMRLGIRGPTADPLTPTRPAVNHPSSSTRVSTSFDWSISTVLNQIRYALTSHHRGLRWHTPAASTDLCVLF